MTVYPEKQGEVFEVVIYPELFTGEFPYSRVEGDRSGDRINFWAHDTGSLSIIKEMNDVAIVRESGHHWRSGLGNFPYAHPRYYIGIFGIGRGHVREKTDCFIVIYSISYSSKTAKKAKELAMELLESLGIECIS